MNAPSGVALAIELEIAGEELAIVRDALAKAKQVLRLASLNGQRREALVDYVVLRETQYRAAFLRFAALRREARSSTGEIV